MQATLSASSWPVPAGLSAHGKSWRFARQVTLGDAAPSEGQTPAWQWLLRRNCTMTPRDLVLAFALLAGVSVCVGLYFLWLGAPAVILFTGLELLALAVALAVTARHAGDHETLTLVGPQLLVEQGLGAQVIRRQLPVAWLEVEPHAGQHSLVQLRSQGQTVRVGRFVRPEWRGELANELRALVRLARESRWAAGDVTLTPTPGANSRP